jgi:hypothetical protein
LRRCDSASGAPDPPSHSVPTGCRLSRRGDYGFPERESSAGRGRQAGYVRRTGEMRDPIPPDGGRRDENMQHRRSFARDGHQIPLHACFSSLLPFTVHVSRRGVHRKDETHTARCLKNPHVSPNSQSSQYRHASVRSHRLPHALGVTDNRHTRRDYVAKITGYGTATRRRPAWTAHALEVDAWLRRAA